MRKKTSLPHMPDYRFDITPMVDIVFLLIIFFMVVAAEITEKIPLEVPQADRAIIPKETGNRLSISILEDGTLYRGLRPLSLEELGPMVRRSIKLKDFKVYLRADAATPHKYVRRVMDKVNSLGVSRVLFGTLQQGGGNDE